MAYTEYVTIFFYNYFKNEIFKKLCKILRFSRNNRNFDIKGQLCLGCFGQYCSNLEHHLSTANLTTKEWVYPKTDIGINYTEFICDLDDLPGA